MEFEKMFDPLPSDTFQPGQILNNTYEIVGVLGRGGTGQAYLARNQVTGRMVAIKALNTQFSNNEAFSDLLAREMQMRDILDDAVVRYTECSRSDQGHVFLVMDYIEGPSISDIMQERRLEPRELMIIAHRVAEGLMAAHRKGIVHRDLSPDNVILRGGSPERATIIDFGIAKDTAAGARTIVGNDFAGKYEYAAPEQLEGRAEPRSDLYALGATLLAAFRGQVPFSGATPGEMVRRKQAPLDTLGLTEPLKGLIEWLTAPKLDDRAPSAQAVVTRVDQALKVPTTRNTRAAPPAARSGGDAAPRRGYVWVLLLLIVIGGGGAGAYYAYSTGQFDRFFVQEQVVAKPFVFSARPPDQNVAQFKGNAPDGGAASLMAKAYTVLTGVTPPRDALALALGAPDANWPKAVADGLAALAGIVDWTFEISDMTATVTGIADDSAARIAAEDRLNAWAKAGGFALTLDLKTGPRDLTGAQVDALLADLSDCGKLGRGTPPPESYALGDTLRVDGYVGATNKIKGLEEALKAQIGDRKLDLSIQALNAPICKIRPLLPKVASNGMSIFLMEGVTEVANPSGVFHVGDNPVISVLVPSSVTGARLDVFLVLEDGGVYSLLPNAYREDNLIDNVGKVQNGVRAVTVAYPSSLPDTPEYMPQFAFNDKSFGKSEIVAILSKEGLFDVRRPGQETAEGLAVALEKIQEQMKDNVLAVASATMESRP